jgi:hypothetical protein
MIQSKEASMLIFKFEPSSLTFKAREQYWDFFSCDLNTFKLTRLKPLKQKKDSRKLVDFVPQEKDETKYETIFDFDFEKKSSEMVEVLDMILWLKKELVDFENKEKILKDEIVSICKEKNCKGSLLKICKISRKGTIDYSQIPELKNIDIDVYRKKPIEFWKISRV